jgi:pyruvate ferredoxin oxidoreductase alpha subunit
VEKLADFVYNGDLDSEIINVESEHSAMAAAVGASATGVRVFTSTSSQGLAYMWEMLHIVSGMRLPIVMAVANRALSAPINIWNDHQDSMSSRDTGWIQLYVENSQEALDTVFQSYKIAEDHKVLLPVMICLDGFSLSHVYEPTDVPGDVEVKRYLPDFNPVFKLDPENPCTLGPIGYPDVYMELRKQQADAMLNALEKIKDANREFGNLFGRRYGNGLIDTYKLEDAKFGIVTMGSITGTARVAVDELRKEGNMVGILKIRSFRPFPSQEIVKAVSKMKGIAVIDRSVSPGNESGLCSEVKSVLKNSDVKVRGFIAGLGGRDVTVDHLKIAFKKIMEESSTDTEWLF